MADDRRIGGVLFFPFFFLLCAQSLTASVIYGQGGERFPVLQRTQARGFKGNFETLKQKTGCFFFPDRSLSRLNFLFSLDFLRNDIFSPHGLYKGGVAGEVRYRVSFRINPCAEPASVCQARACIGTRIHPLGRIGRGTQRVALGASKRRRARSHRRATAVIVCAFTGNMCPGKTC